MRGRRISGKAVSTFGIMLLFCACALLFYNIWDNGRADRSIEDASRRLEQYRLSQQEDVSTLTIPDDLSNLDPNRGMPEVSIKGITYIGNLQVPSLGLDLPVISDWSYKRLKVAPCRYTGSVYLDNMVVAAHNYRRHFGPLRSLEIGEEIRFTDMDGNEFRYVVMDNEIIQPTEIEKMVISDYDLTLFTCVPSGKARFAIRCNRMVENESSISNQSQAYTG